MPSLSSICRVAIVCSVTLFQLPLAVAGHVADSAKHYGGQGGSHDGNGRERSSLNAGWHFSRFNSSPDGLSYDILKPWVLPSGNGFLLNGTQFHRPSGTAPGKHVKYVHADFDDSDWEQLDLPHDWAIKGPFNAPGISSGMGRLPSNGIGWYRRSLSYGSADKGKNVYLDIDGAMSHSAVWLNGHLVGGWPYGYNSYRLELTEYLQEGNDNILAIRLENYVASSRWYPGAGIYRNVWLVKTDTTHIAQYGTYITTPSISASAATVDLSVNIENTGKSSRNIDVTTDVFAQNHGYGASKPVATFSTKHAAVAAGSKTFVNSSVTIAHPKRWGPPPSQTPNLYVAVTTVSSHGQMIDKYETVFGIRDLIFDNNKGLIINGEAVRVQGTNNHHDQGGLGSAFHTRAAQRQIQLLQEMGGNAMRMSHNPPAPELLDQADQLGMVVFDEIFDCWSTQKVPNDFHLIWTDWHEQDLRNFIRRDRNHPSVINWSIGNEIPEQFSDVGYTTGQQLKEICKSEDPSRLVTASLNARPGEGLPNAVEISSLNYQGEGSGVTYNSTFPAFREAYPDRMIWTSESAAALSTRGTYTFPIVANRSAIASNVTGFGEDVKMKFVSDYDLYSSFYGSSADKVFYQQDHYPFVAGEFIWTGFDYIGEPTPFDGTQTTADARSAYNGPIDLAGFKKDRFHLYQARWRPDLPMAHLLPHWNWPQRKGMVTPVHLFTSGDEAELFVNGKSAGRQKKHQFEYRIRWDEVVYEPGEIHVVVYKNGRKWATDSRRTTGSASSLHLSADRYVIDSDGNDLSYVTVSVNDKHGQLVPNAANTISFAIKGPGEIIATDNGWQGDFTPFPSLTRDALSGMALAVVRSKPGSRGPITVTAASSGLRSAKVGIRAQ